ncbi:hypothetical protein ED733_002620 [Metarhizium rileyi]|uniref:Uncharacterized protein n=1 Tax=Metarhizium rileyi (strain RCEF 4871) TaxID=1649241 RepID=A0A5C6G1Y5_METRR|nr:hypothetical protein ED733_002620 [Metarhizium rileyi]
MDSIVGTLYWLNLFVRQLLCIGIALIPRKLAFRDAIVSTSSHFIAFNLLHLGSVTLVAYSYFAWAQIILVLNFANMSSLYFRYHHHALLAHSALVSGPLSWTSFAMYWNGFRISPRSEGAHIVGSIFLWRMLGYGLFFAFAYKDFTNASS